MTADRACRDSLHHVAGILDAAVSDDAFAHLLGFLGAIADRRHLWHADTGNHAGGANGAGADTDLYAVRTRLKQRARRGGRRHVARDQLNIRERRTNFLNLAEHADAVAMRSVDADDIHARGNQRRNAVKHVVAHADSRAAEQTAGRVLCRIGILLRLLNILDGNQAAQMTFLIHQRELFNAVLGQNLTRLFMGRADRRGNQILGGHHLVNRAGVIGFKTEVAVGQNANQLARFVGDRHAGNAIARHQLFRVGNEIIRAEVERVGNDAVLASASRGQPPAPAARWTCSYG